MHIIDERENSFEYEEDAQDKFLDFKLPKDEFDPKELFMRGKRMESEAASAGSSPSRLTRSNSPPGTKKRKRGDAKPRDASIADTDEPRTSPMRSSPPKATTRSGRGTNKSMGRVQAGSRSRQESKETTADEEGDEDAEEDEEDEDEGTPSVKAVKGKSKDTPARGQKKARKSTRKK